MDTSPVETQEPAGQTPDPAVAKADDFVGMRIISDPSQPKDRIRFIDGEGRCVGEIVMDAEDGTTDGEPLETKAGA